MSDKVTVDTVTHDPTTDEIVLYFVENGPWPQDANELTPVLKRIQDKILDAVDASIDGGIASMCKESIGKKIRIQIDSPHGCPEKLAQLIGKVDRYLADSDEYAAAIKDSKYISGIRVVTG